MSTIKADRLDAYESLDVSDFTGNVGYRLLRSIVSGGIGLTDDQLGEFAAEYPYINTANRHHALKKARACRVMRRFDGLINSADVDAAVRHETVLCFHT